MNIQVLASSSSGNAVVVSEGESSILLDAGIPFRELSAYIRPSCISAVLVTHEHMDHCKAVPELLRRGHKVYMSYAMKRVKDFKGAISLIRYDQINLYPWMFKAFPVQHDSVEPFGFLVQSMLTGKKLIYITDAGKVPTDFKFIKDVNYLLIEVNYSDEHLDNSPLEDFIKNRIRKAHLSIEQVEDYLRSFSVKQMSQLDEIHLLHLSADNANLLEFQKRVIRLTGVPVYVNRDPDIQSWT